MRGRTFKKILEPNEKIQRAFRPNFFVRLFFPLLIPVALGLTVYFVAKMQTVIDLIAKIPYVGEYNYLGMNVLVLGILGILVLIALIMIWTYFSVCYCYTERRVIIRKGIIFVSYNSIYLESMGVIKIKRNILDVFFGTGTLFFASSSAPEYSGSFSYKFKSIGRVYKTARKLKAQADENTKKLMESVIQAQQSAYQQMMPALAPASASGQYEDPHDFYSPPPYYGQ